MRRCFALSLLLVAAFARIGAAGAVAETPAPPAETATAETDEVTPTVQLVQVWPKTKQALMFDPIHGTYVVVSAGQTVDGFRVARVGKRQVTLAEIRTDGPAREFVLLPTPVDPGDPVTGAPGAVTGVTVIGAAPTTSAPTAPPSTTVPTAPTTTGPTATAPTPTPTSPPTPATPAPAILDPYPSDVLDPYGHDGLRVVQAPADQRAPGATVAPAPIAGTPATPAPIGPAKPTIPSVIPAPIPAPKPAIPSTPTAPVIPAVRTTPSTPPTASTSADHVVLSRRELDASLGDFARLTHDSQLALGTGGVSFTRVAAGSLFARVGLRDGDRINAINGVMIRSIDDAAGLYARLGTLDHLSLDVVRGTTKLVLRCDLTK